MFDADNTAPPVSRTRSPRGARHAAGVSRRSARHLVVAVATLALSAAGGAVLASPATAAASERLYYTCSSPDLGTFTASAIHRVKPEDRLLRPDGRAADRPVEVVYSGWVKVTTTLLLPATVVRALNSDYVSALDGSAATRASLGAATLVSEQGFYKTPVPESGAMKLVAPGYLNIGPAGIDAGESGELDMADVEGSDFTAQLYSYYGDSRFEEPSPLRCELADDQDPDLATVAVTKAPVRGYASKRYNDKTGKVVVSVGLSAVYSTATPVGPMTLTLKRDGETIDSKTGQLENGRLVMRTVAPKDGDYELIDEYDGNQNFGGEIGSWSFSFS